MFFHSIKPGIYAFAFSLSQSVGELLDQLVRLGNLCILLAELVEVILLPVQALPSLTSHPKSDLASRGRPFFLHFLWANHGCNFRFHRLEATSLPILFSQRTHKAANSRRRTSLSLLFDLTIHLLGTATSLVPPLDEIVFVGVNEPSASKIYSRPLWWLLHLEGVRDRLAAYPKLAGHVGYINLFRCQIVDLVGEFYSLLVQTLTLFFRVLCHSRMEGELALAAHPPRGLDLRADSSAT